MSVEWIEKGLEKPGKSRTGLARAFGKAPSMVTSLLNGTRELKAREIAIVAKYLEVEPPPTITPPSPFDADNPGLTKLEVIGEVAAGVWTEPEADTFERYSVEVPLDPRFPASSQYLLKVRGSSINRRAASGSLVRCLEVFSAPRKPKSGDWVVVRRMKNDSAETTVKRFELNELGNGVLWPDSSDPSFQEPIEVGIRDGDEVQIVAFVLDFINPATRF